MSQVMSNNQVEIEDAGPCRKKISITIPAETVDESIETSFAAVASEAALPGFRPGRVPRKLIEKRFGSAVRDEAKNQIIGGAYSQAIEDHNIEAVGEPEAEHLADLAVEPGQEISFSVEVDVAPEFETPNLEGFSIDKPVIEVTDEQVDRQLDRICRAEGELEPIDQAGRGHYIIGQGKLVCEGDEVLDLPGAVVQIPDEGEDKGMILGVIVDDLATQVGTPKSGDSITVNATGPKHHENEAIREKPVEITFAVEQTYEIKPVTPAELVAKYGMSDEKQLRDNLELRLNQRGMMEQQSAMRQQVARQLLDSVSFDLPEKLSAAQADRNLQRRRYDLMHRGVDPAVIEKRIAEMRDSSAETAQRELKLFFILSKLAKDMSVEVTEQEVRGRIAQIAAEQQMRPADVAKRLQETNQIPMIFQQIREHKTIDAVLEKATVTELPAEEYNKKIRGDDELHEVDPTAE
ncbi:MAG: trigger factor [Planctomycetota bacterium]